MTVPHPLAAQLQQAMQCLQAGDCAGAEGIASRLLLARPADPDGLHLLALVRLRQKRTAEAVPLLERAIAVHGRDPAAHLNLAAALTALGRDSEAVTSFTRAAGLDRNSFAAQAGLGRVLARMQRPGDAEGPLQIALRLKPGDMGLVLALGGVLLALRKEEEAEALFRDAIAHTRDDATLAQLWNNLALAQRNRGDEAAALASCEAAQAGSSSFAHLDALRADTLDALQRHDEAFAVLERMLARDPHNLAAHMHRASLSYRLARDDIFASFDRAPPTPQLRAARAGLLLQLERGAEAAMLYDRLVAEHPGEPGHLRGLGAARIAEGRLEEAVAAFEAALARAPQDVDLHGQLASALLRAHAPDRAAQVAAHGHVLNPGHQQCLALLGTAWRVLGDERDEDLNRYDTLIRIYDLEPPDGFSDMASFNAELAGFLETRHPRTREFLEQSLRGGTQTHNYLFGAGHDLVERIGVRIREALARYAAESNAPPNHPFAVRRRQNVRMTNSWSSRLGDRGFHANHVHNQGWISSCYYVALPDVVADTQRKQGWIKFGEPSFEAGLADPVRKAIQPVTGRLVLFPSYMWHGTVPFEAEQARTTIAFDAVPA